MVSSKKDKFLLSLSSFLLCCIPFTLLTGPFLPDLFISLIGLIFLYISISKNNFFYFKNNFFYFFIIFYFIFVVSSLTSEFFILSIKSSLVYFRFGLFAIACYFILDNNSKILRPFTVAFLLAYFFAISDGFSQYFFERSILLDLENIPSRLHLPFNDEAVMGNYLTRMFPILFASLLMTFEPKKIFIIGLMFLIVIVDVLVFISGERTALGLMTISTIMIIIFMSNFRIIRIFTLVLSMILIVIIATIDSDVKERNVDQTLSQIGISEESEQIYVFSEIHQDHFISALKIFRDNFLLGSGPNSYREACRNEKYYENINSCSTHPHNTYVQVLSETGLIGSLYLVTILFYILAKLYRQLHKMILLKNNYYDDKFICIIISISLTVFPFLPTLNFFNNWINVIYYLPVGFFLYLNNEKNKKNDYS